MPRRDLPLKGHRDECTTTTCFCLDAENGDPMCDGCWQAACFCDCEHEDPEEGASHIEFLEVDDEH